MTASGTQKHGESVTRKPVSAGLDVVIRRLIDSPQISRSVLLELFEHRASYAAITAWRFGWRGAPQWAIDLIRDKLAARAAADLAAGAKLQAGKGLSGGGAIGAKALAAWRERKARERDEKEKAAEAALSQSPD